MCLARGYVGNADPLLLSVPRGSLGGREAFKAPHLNNNNPVRTGRAPRSGAALRQSECHLVKHSRRSHMAGINNDGPVSGMWKGHVLVSRAVFLL